MFYFTETQIQCSFLNVTWLSYCEQINNFKLNKFFLLLDKALFTRAHISAEKALSWTILIESFWIQILKNSPAKSFFSAWFVLVWNPLKSLKNIKVQNSSVSSSTLTRQIQSVVTTSIDRFLCFNIYFYEARPVLQYLVKFLPQYSYHKSCFLALLF